MLRPMLIIGIGGSGGKTIRSMIQALNRKFDSIGYTDGMPSAWQFLQIDTTYDGVEFPAPMLDKSQFHSVVPSGQTFNGVRDHIMASGDNSAQQQMLAGWGVYSSRIRLEDGAGQIRAIGRQAGVADYADTLKAVQTAIAKMSGATSMGELANVATALKAKAPSPTPQAFIISSIAGGSGSGMFFDVAELLKRASDKPWCKEAISFLYTSDVFKSLGVAGKDVAKNALGAFNEFMASKWVAPTERSELLAQRMGLGPIPQDTRREFGAAGNILVGSTNKEGIDISQGPDASGMNEVFLTIGEALAGALTNDDISEWYYQAAFVNITQTKAAVDSTGLSPLNPSNPTFSAAGIGFGQLSLGADRIVDYVADALTRKQVEKLLWPQLTPALLKDGVTHSSLIADKANEIWPNFLLDSGLDEKAAQDQIIDELFPADWQNEVNQFARGIIRKSVSDRPAPLANFARGTWSEWETESSGFLKEMREKINANARAWVPSIQKKLITQISHELTANGFAVVSNLVERLRKELNDYSLSDLIREHESLASAVKNFDRSSYEARIQEVAEGLTGVNNQNGPFLDRATQTFARVLEFQIKSHVNNLGASLIVDILQYFFEPLRESLVDARYVLEEQLKLDSLPDGKKNNYKNFPDWGSGIVPTRYKPRTIERILIDTTEYEKIFEAYGGMDAGGAAPFPMSIGASLLGKSLNPMPGEINAQTLIEESLPWSTSVRDAQDQMGVAVTKVRWEFNTSLAALGERNRAWLKKDKSSFGNFTRMSIREFVNGAGIPPQERTKRESAFVTQYQAMIKLAEPLVSLNLSAMNYVKSVKDGRPAVNSMPKSSKIPFAMGSSIGQQCTQFLGSIGVDINSPAFENNWFNDSNDSTTMYATSTTQASLPAWAFQSLTEPILDQVAVSKLDKDNWRQFWDGRRGRPICEAIPFETEMRRSMVTGWYVAALFGLRESSNNDSGHTLQIWNPTLNVEGWSHFPAPLLAPHDVDATKGWLLPAALVSAGLAMCEFGKTGNLDILNPYKFLLHLGREVTTKLEDRDMWEMPGIGNSLPNGQQEKAEYIVKWLEGGVKPGAKIPLLDILENRVNAGLDRRQALLDTVAELQTQYKNIWAEYKNTSWHRMPEVWELQEDIDLALGDIFNYVNELHTVSARTSA